MQKNSCLNYQAAVLYHNREVISEFDNIIQNTIFVLLFISVIKIIIVYDFIRHSVA